MGTFNAAVFSLLGTLMGFIPALLPSHFAIARIGGFNSSELWLELMGGVQASLGSFYIIRNEVVPFVLRAIAWCTPATHPAGQPQSAGILRPMAVRYLSGHGAREPEVAA